MRFCFYCLLIPAVTTTPALPQIATASRPMAHDAHPSFSVAAIKPHDPDSPRQGFYAHAERFTIQPQTAVIHCARIKGAFISPRIIGNASVPILAAINLVRLEAFSFGGTWPRMISSLRLRRFAPLTPATHGTRDST